MTFALHAEGPQFDPGLNHINLFFCLKVFHQFGTYWFTLILKHVTKGLSNDFMCNYSM